MSDTTSTSHPATSTGSTSGASTGPTSSTSPDLASIGRDIEELKRHVSDILQRVEHSAQTSHGGSIHDSHRQGHGLRNGVAGLETVAESALASVASERWVTEGTSWVRETPLLSVFGTLLLGWSLASMFRR